MKPVPASGIRFEGFIKKDDLLKELNNSGIEYDAEINKIIMDMPEFGLEFAEIWTPKTRMGQLAKNMGGKLIEGVVE